MIIVAEYIENTDHPGYRPVFIEAVTFMSTSQTQDLFVASERYLTWRTHEWVLLTSYLISNNITLKSASDGRKQQ